MNKRKSKKYQGQEEVILSGFIIFGALVSAFYNLGFGLIIGISGIIYYIWKTFDVLGRLNYER